MTFREVKPYLGRGRNHLLSSQVEFIKGVPERAEFELMREHPDVFIKTEILTDDEMALIPERRKGFVYAKMPLAEPLNPADGPYAILPALDKLQLLWKIEEDENDRWADLLTLHLIGISPFGATHTAKLVKLVQWLARTRSGQYTNTRIHGDPTLANLVVLHGEWHWVDPLRRNYIPHDPHVDLGKIFQSGCGYEQHIGSNYSQDLDLNYRFMQYVADHLKLDYYTGLVWMIIHYVRLIRYQKEEQTKKNVIEFLEKLFATVVNDVRL